MIKYTVTLLALLLTTAAGAEETKTFALVPKFMNHPFFNLAHEGCRKAEREIPGIKCLFIAPAEPDEQAQLQVIQDLITRRVAGIAVAPANAPAMGRILRMANSAGIPVITWDSDLLEGDRALRRSYIGTRNYDMGVELAKALIALKPDGGTIAIQTGGAAAANLNERIQGIRDTLKDRGWSEPPGTPLYNNDDSVLAVKQMEDILAKYPSLDAFVPVGGWPQVVQNAYRLVAAKHLERIKGGSLIIIAGDTMPMQMEILKDGLGHGLIGQRPFQMGYKSMQILKDITDGKAVADPIYTGLDICTSATVSTCITSAE